MKKSKSSAATTYDRNAEGGTETGQKDQKLRALNSAMEKIQKDHGKGAVMKMNEAPRNWPSYSTGSLGLDMAVGIGGVPKGRVTEIYGPESSGKTTIALEVIANCQAEGGICAFIDAEHALDPNYANALGVDMDELIVSQPDSGEDALDICETLVASGAIDVIVIDSVAALTPKAEIEGEMGDSQPGLQARLMSQAMRKLTSQIQRTGTTVLFINQIRMKIGVTFGSPETTTGGNALKFYASLRLDIRRIGSIKDKSGEVLGNQTKVKVVKNKLSPPFRVVEFDIMYGQGVSQTNELIELGVSHNIVDKSGSWFSYQGQRLGQGKEKTAEMLVSNPDIAGEIRTKIIQAAGMAELFGAGSPETPPDAGGETKAA